MYTKFYDNSIVSQFIKELLSTTPVPLVKVWKRGEKAYKNTPYIIPGKIVSLRSDFTGSIPTEKDFITVKEFIPYKEYNGITFKYKSNTYLYDPDTHKWLGNYLRFLRDYYNIDLMPFYNCFCGDYIDNSDIVDKMLVSNSYNTLYKIISVPVRFGQTYNLSIQCDTPLEITYDFYGPKGIINNTPIHSIDANLSYMKLPKCDFRNPVTIRSPESNRYLYQYERYLRMFIKIPVTNTSSVVVIEGDISKDPRLNNRNAENSKNVYSCKTGVYTNILKTCNSTTTEGTQIPDCKLSLEETTSHIADSSIDRCLSPLGLLQWDDGNTYAFSNRLIEYLLSNVISPVDEITSNIDTVQTKITSYNSYSDAHMYRNSYTPGVWNDSMTRYIYEMRRLRVFSPKGASNIDYNGYVDKDTEYILNRGR